MPTDKQDRARDVRAVVASARLEGVAITPDALALFDAYAVGIIDSDELARQVLQMIREPRSNPSGRTEFTAA
jgi:hypothetical protein